MVPGEKQPRIPLYAGFDEINPEKNRFFIVGDTQKTSCWEFWRERNDRERKLIIDEIAGREPAFVVHLGDLTARGSSRKHWHEFDELYRPIREKNIPCFPILGNHEFYGRDAIALRYFFGHFLHVERRRWYSFIWKHVAFIMLDSGFETLTKEQTGTQAEWYLAELDKFERDGNVDHVIACCHRPPFTNSRVIRPSGKSKTYFAGPFTRFGKARLFFSGHSHTYERFEHGGKTFVVSGGGGGPRHKVTLLPAKRRIRDLYPGPELRFFHFCLVEVRARALAYEVLRLDSDGTFTAVDPLTFPLR